ncbi:MAG TPA: secretin N-terminal domain-containing protein [Opitutaceae bacterium]|nr:secretin N-terminal domain-containing protein [Opitutaceae bacterium]
MIPRLVRPCLAAGLILLAFPPLHAQTTPRPAMRPAAANGRDDYSYNIQGAAVDDVLATLEEYTGRTVIRPQALPPATYTITANHFTKAELITAIETLLEKNQVAVIPLGERFLEVVPLAMARSEAPEFIEGTSLDRPPSGQIVTKLFQLQYLRVNEFFNPQMITSMFTAGTGGGVVPLEKSNAALVTDTLANIQRTERLLDSIDRPTGIGLTPKFYPLANATAATLVNKLHSILTGPISSQLGTTTTYTADERSNQIVVLSDPRQWPLFDDLIHKLDIPSNPNTRNEVIYLKHADANTLYPELSSLVQGSVAAAQKAASSAQSVRPGEVGYQPASGQSGNAGIPMQIGPPQPVPGAAPGAPGAAGAPRQGLAAALSNNATGEGTNNEFSGLVTVLADERSNAIIVSGTPDDIRLVKDLVEKLDVVLAQVRIDVVIAEVTLTDTDQSGISALNLTFGTDQTRGTHITNFAGSVPGWDVTSGVVNPLSFVAAMNSTSAGSKNQVKVLSAPTIMTTHAKQGEVNVSTSEPIITGTSSTPTTTAGPTTSSSVTYQKIGIDLKVTPLIGDDGSVQMTIDQSVQNIQGSVTIDGNQQPIIGNREATSFVTVPDGQMIVLGGLQQVSKETDHQKIGLLYEIPIISQLLGGHTDKLTRTELLLFIRPHVVNPRMASMETEQAIRSMDNKDQINNYLNDPKRLDDNSKAQNLIDRFKSN